MKYRSVIVVESAAGMRLDLYVSTRFPGWSRSAVSNAIKCGRIISPNRKMKPSTILMANEELHLYSDRYTPSTPKPPYPDVIWEDEHAVAFSKPAGMLCHPVGRKFAWGLINLARDLYPDNDLHLAHRLDRETSGVLLVAKSPEMNRHLKRMFQERRVSKEYLALVRGVIPWDKMLVDGEIQQDMSSPIGIKQGVSEGGQMAATEIIVEQRLSARTLVRCKPRTGRTHQIRVHLDHIGFPILGDKIYGQPAEVFLSIFEGRPLPNLDELLEHPRHCLHAESRKITHKDRNRVVAETPIPEDMRGVIEAG
jgi:23S rRNA pseudouridine1911/1915/1917 synthase